MFLVSIVAKPLCIRAAPESPVEQIAYDYRYFESMYEDHLAGLRSEGLDGKRFARLQEEFEARITRLPLDEVRADECGKMVSIVDQFNKAITPASAVVADQCGNYFPGFGTSMDAWKKANRAFLQESEGDQFYSCFRQERARLLTGMNDGRMKGECELIFDHIRRLP